MLIPNYIGTWKTDTTFFDGKNKTNPEMEIMVVRSSKYEATGDVFHGIFPEEAHKYSVLEARVIPDALGKTLEEAGDGPERYIVEWIWSDKNQYFR